MNLVVLCPSDRLSSKNAVHVRQRNIQLTCSWNKLSLLQILQVQTEKNRKVTRTINMYNLDMIISLGYRINSKNGIIFRKWANSILKQYLLNGHAINEDRCLNCTSNIISLENKYRNIEERLNNIEESLYSSESIIYEGEILEPYTFLRKLFFLAKNELIIVDYYADKFLLSMLLNVHLI